VLLQNFILISLEATLSSNMESYGIWNQLRLIAHVDELQYNPDFDI